MLRALPLFIWVAEVLGGISRPSSAPRILLARRIAVLDHAAVKESSRLIPGIVEDMPEAIDKVHAATGWTAPPITKNHQGFHHVCQPWEDCDAQRDVYEEEVEDASKEKKEGTLTVQKNGAVILPPRKCPEWGATQLGCECLDSCECGKLQGPAFAPVHRCATRKVKSEADGSETPCGNTDASQQWYDTCLVHTTPFPRPVLNLQPPVSEPDPVIQSDGTELWRNYNSFKNKRFLPKRGCYSRDQYCADFPKFHGCDPQKSYGRLIRSHLTEEQLATVKKCKANDDQKKCEEIKECGKGKDSTCHHTCVWSEDAPNWFRELRGEANMKIKKSRQDPAVVNDGENLPVLQPGSGTSGGQFGSDPKETAIKKSDKMDKAGSHLTTPPPDAQVLAGDVGTKRSEGWLDPADVGKNIGSDNQAVGKFRPQRGAKDSLGL